MNIELVKELASITSAISRVNGLYQKWAHKKGVNYGASQIFFALSAMGYVTQKQICENYEIPKQTVNNVIRELKRDGYIDLVPGDSDRREKKIILTQLGEARSRELLEPLFELDEKVIQRVGIKLIHQMIESVNTYGDALEMEMELEEISSSWKDRKKAVPR